MAGHIEGGYRALAADQRQSLGNVIRLRPAYGLSSLRGCRCLSFDRGG